MAVKGVCTSPNGVAGCTSPTCPGGSFNANLGTLRFNHKYMIDAGLYTDNEDLAEERESIEIEMDLAIAAMFEDYMLMGEKDRQDIFEELNSEEKELFEKYLPEEQYDTLIATMVFNDDQRSDIVKNYLIAAVWTGEAEDETEDPDAWNVNNIAEESVAQAVKDVDKIISKASLASFIVKDTGYGRNVNASTTEMFGHDLYLTRNHEGAGFWDRPELKDMNGLKVGQILTEKTQENLKPTSLVKGDDGKLYFE